jgi:hypothetical protein
MGRKTPAKGRRLVLGLALTLVLSACAVPLLLPATYNNAITAASYVSTLVTGKGTGEHLLDLATGQDCRVLRSLLASRPLCQRQGGAPPKSPVEDIAHWFGFEVDAGIEALAGTRGSVGRDGEPGSETSSGPAAAANR